MTSHIPSRRYDLDWLRIIAFGLLIFYHIGMFYVPWDWHVKSIHAGSFLEPVMLLLNPWRMSLLFLISGVALKFMSDKGGLANLAKQRFWRLFVPLFLGIVFIVVPQSYFELLGKGEVREGYMAFWVKYLSAQQGFSIIVPTWNHLWYVVYLLVYTLVIIPFLPLLGRLAEWLDCARFEKIMSGGRILILPALLFVFYRFTTDLLFPDVTHALVDDWGAHTRYFSYFIIGVLIAKNQAFWNVLATSWRTGMWFAIGSAIILTPLWANWETVVEPNMALMIPVLAWRVIFAWIVIMALLGAGQQYLNRPSKTIHYLTEAVFPYYILHQTLIVVLGVALTSLGLSVATEVTLLTIGTFAGCYLLHELIIRRIPLLRPLFGVPMKPKPEAKAMVQAV